MKTLSSGTKWQDAQAGQALNARNNMRQRDEPLVQPRGVRPVVFCFTWRENPAAY